MTTEKQTSLRPAPSVRLRIGERAVTLLDSPLLRAAAELIETMEANPPLREGEIERQQVHTLGRALHRFMRALVGPAASDEVVEGLVYIALLHRVQPRSTG
jgi:hypothetical protein